MAKKIIFHDPNNTREIIIKRVLLLFWCIFGIFTVFMLLSIVLKPILPLPTIFKNLVSTKHAISHLKQAFDREKLEKDTNVVHTLPKTWNVPRSNIVTPDAFLVEWDDASFASLQANIGRIDTLVSEELNLTSTGVRVMYPDKFQRTLTFVRTQKPDLQFLALINNFSEKSNSWDSEVLKNNLSDPLKRGTLESQLLNFAEKNKIDGINIDFEEIPDSVFPDFYLFLEELERKLHDKELVLQVNVPLHNDSFDYKKISQSVDIMVVMAYDEHWATGNPGAISSLDWFQDGVKNILELASPDKVSIAIWNYGYDWTIGKKSSQALTFQEAQTLMREQWETIDFENESLNPDFSYVDEKGKDHEVWYLDAVTAYNEIISASDLGATNISLWRLGSEDPSLWKLFENTNLDNNLKPTELEKFAYGYTIDYSGNGELYKVTRTPKEGMRSLNFSGWLVTNETISAFALPYEISRYWGGAKKKITITFDDGPDENYTPAILDILKNYHVTATFFIVGEQWEKFPSLLKRIFDEGNIIGNHSFTHPDISKISPLHTNIELSLTERLIESITGYKTILFRPPYWEDIEPEVPSEIAPLENANAMGYITVGMKIDPGDWKKPWVDAIVRNALEQANEERWSILLLHDSGGDRSQTVEALPKIIETLRDNGYEIVSLPDLIGLPKDALMPISSGIDKTLSGSDYFTFLFLFFFIWSIYYVFTIVLIIWIIRLIIILSFAYIQSKRVKKYFRRDFHPFVSIILPAFNEEKVITQTLESLLFSEYPHYEIIVVDDGSKDKTYEKAIESSKNDHRIRVLTQQNSGKWEAINFWIQHSDSEIIIVIDADTLFTPHTIWELVKHFTDPNIWAVSGNVKVGNRINLMTKMQALEYISTQNLDRRAYDILNTITVVPWAVGAWRKDAILKAGGFTSETLAEDSDLTISILRLWYKIVHEDNAIAYTEAPDSLSAFRKQRLRWSFWILQVTYKHIGLFFDKKISLWLRFFVFPQMIIFQVIAPLFSPLIDIIAFGGLFISLVNYFVFWSTNHLDFTLILLAYAFLFFLIDFMVWYIAFYFEHYEDKTLLYLFPLQRAFYRFFMYYIQIKVLWWAFTGKLMLWNKLDRKSTAKLLSKI